MSKTKDRMRENNLRYKQSLGQNFLYDEALLAELTEAAGVTKDEDVLEIGPGCGSLTKHLCGAANRVLAVELDERLIPLLRAFLDEQKNLTVVQGDVMALNLQEVTADLKKPFAKGSESRRNMGTGLGLAIAENNLVLLGYKLDVKSEGGNFVVTVTL